MNGSISLINFIFIFSAIANSAFLSGSIAPFSSSGVNASDNSNAPLIAPIVTATPAAVPAAPLTKFLAKLPAELGVFGVLLRA